MHVSPAALGQPDQDVGDEPEADPVRDRPRERDHHDRQRRGEAEREVAKVDSG